MNIVSKFPPDLCGIADYSEALFKEMNKFEDSVVNIEKIRIEPTINILYYIKLAFKARKADIVHIQFDYSYFYKFGIYSPIFYLFLKFPYFSKNIITTMHEIIDINQYTGFKGFITKFYGKIINFILFKFSTKVIVHNELSRDKLIKQKVEPSKIIVIPHASYTESKPLNKKLAKDQLNLPEKKILLLFGFIHPQKGYDQVIDILNYLDEEITILICGKSNKEHDDYFEELMNLIKKYEIKKKIRYYGYVKKEDIHVVFSSADIVILPYLRIEQSGILSRSLAYKSTVLASNLSYFKEISNKYGCILTFRNFDKEDLLKKIYLLLNDNNLRRHLKENIKDYLNDTNLNLISRKHMELYYFLSEGGHPDSIYTDKKQIERIDWLKTKKKGKTLEVGCSTGYVTNYVDADVGIDIDQFRIMLAQNKYPYKKFLKSDASNLPFKDNSLIQY
ncbi:MAG: glycosyltransferase [Methanomicrobiales archaeon]